VHRDRTQHLHIYVHRDARIIVGVFANNILVGYHSSCADLYMRVKRRYSEQIKIGELGIQPVTEFVGIEITRDRNAGILTISQPGYIDKIYGAYQSLIDSRGSTPSSISYGAWSTRDAFDKMKPADEKEGENECKRVPQRCYRCHRILLQHASPRNHLESL